MNFFFGRDGEPSSRDRNIDSAVRPIESIWNFYCRERERERERDLIELFDVKKWIRLVVNGNDHSRGK